MKIRHSLYRLIEDPAPKGIAARGIRLTLQLFIILNILAVIFESVDEFHETYATQFFVFECASVLKEDTRYARWKVVLLPGSLGGFALLFLPVATRISYFEVRPQAQRIEFSP